MTTTADTNQASDDADLLNILQRMFGSIFETDEHEYVRIPGLHLASELEDIIEPDAEYVVWQSGELQTGRIVLTVYCRRAKPTTGAPPATTEAPASATEPTDDPETTTATAKASAR